MGTDKWNMEKQFETIQNELYKGLYYYIIPQLELFGIRMVNSILPSQTDFRNLTGNTITSLAFGVYDNGKVVSMGFNKHYPPAIRNKLIKGEEVFDFEDYDGNLRKYYRAKIVTDADYGKNTSIDFLQSYKPTGQFAMVFTTGTEYSEYLEQKLKLNVLTDGFEYARNTILQSFKPMKNK